MKKALLLKPMLLLCALIVGVGSTWADDITLNASSGFKASYSSENTFTINSIGFKDNGVMYNGKGTPNGWAVKQLIQMRKSGSSGAGEIYNTTEIKTITSVEVTLVTANNGFTLYYGTTENPSTNSIASSALTPEQGTFSYTNTSGQTATATSYKFTFDLSSYDAKYIKIVNGSNANYVGSIKINYTSFGGSATINFGSSTGKTSINSASVTGNDSKGNTWTIITEGTTSFTPSNDYAQVGSSSKPATSITFTTTLPANYNITAFEAKFGGFGSTAGDITLKVGETTIGSGSLNGTEDVTVTNTLTAVGTMLTVTVTNIAKGVKCYYISYEYEPTTTITLASACTYGDLYYGTYSNRWAFVVPSDLIVSEVSVVDGKLYIEDYDEGDVVPANTGVMVSSVEAGNHTVVLSELDGTSVLGNDNMLKPSGDNGINAATMGTAAPNCLYYRLTMHNGTDIGFWWGAEDGAAFALAANKAYLAVPTDINAPSMGLWIEEETTGIVNVNRETISNNQYYTLDGRRVAEPTKGLYIINGKKVVIK